MGKLCTERTEELVPGEPEQALSGAMEWWKKPPLGHDRKVVRFMTYACSLAFGR